MSGYKQKPEWGEDGEQCTEPELICNPEKSVQPDFSSPSPFRDRVTVIGIAGGVTVEHPRECLLGVAL